MATESSAATIWQGSLTEGSGNTTPASGVFDAVEVTWASRTSRSEGTTSPEELLAMAHASCYCMALAHALGEDGHAPERLDATATVGFVPGEGVKYSHIVVTGKVDGIDQAEFEQAARGAGDGCPISGALKGNIEITVDATLQ